MKTIPCGFCLFLSSRHLLVDSSLYLPGTLVLKVTSCGQFFVSSGHFCPQGTFLRTVSLIFRALLSSRPLLADSSFDFPDTLVHKTPSCGQFLVSSGLFCP